MLEKCLFELRNPGRLGAQAPGPHMVAARPGLADPMLHFPNTLYCPMAYCMRICASMGFAMFKYKPMSMVGKHVIGIQRLYSSVRAS